MPSVICTIPELSRRCHAQFDGKQLCDRMKGVSRPERLGLDLTRVPLGGRAYGESFHAAQPGTAAFERGPWRTPTMSIDKQSSGLPGMNVHKRTTKVNLSIVIGVALFFAVTFSVVWWLWSSNR